MPANVQAEISELASRSKANGGPADRSIILAEVAVTRRLLAATMRAAVLLALELRVDGDRVREILDPMLRDHRLAPEAAQTAIAYIAMAAEAETP